MKDENIADFPFCNRAMQSFTTFVLNETIIEKLQLYERMHCTQSSIFETEIGTCTFKKHEKHFVLSRLHSSLKLHINFPRRKTAMNSFGC